MRLHASPPSRSSIQALRARATGKPWPACSQVPPKTSVLGEELGVEGWLTAHQGWRGAASPLNWNKYSSTPHIPLVEGRVCGVCGVCVHECGCLHGLGATPKRNSGVRMASGSAHLAGTRACFLARGVQHPQQTSSEQVAQKASGVYPVATRGSRPAAPGPLTGLLALQKPEDTRIRLRPREGKKEASTGRERFKKKSRQTYLQSSQIPGSWADNMAQDKANFLDLRQLAKFAK